LLDVREVGGYEPIMITLDLKATGFTLRPASLRQWPRFATHHYRPARPVAPRRIWMALSPRRQNVEPQPAAIIVYAYPVLASAARNLATHRAYVPTSANRRETATRINRDFTTLCRIVVLPDFRQQGLPLRMLTTTLPLVGTPYVESFSVIGRSLGFFKAAGFQMFEPPETQAAHRLRQQLSRYPLPLCCQHNAKALTRFLRDTPDGEAHNTVGAIRAWAATHDLGGSSRGRPLTHTRAAYLYLTHFNSPALYGLWTRDDVCQDPHGLDASTPPEALP